MVCYEATPVVTNCIVLVELPFGSVSSCLDFGDPLFVEPGEFDPYRFVTVEIGDESYELPNFIVDRPDYHLLPDSPAIDAGTSQDAPPADMDGIPRPCGDGIDIGAYEYCEIEPVAMFRRGDVNADGERNIADAISLLCHLF